MRKIAALVLCMVFMAGIAFAGNETVKSGDAVKMPKRQQLMKLYNQQKKKVKNLKTSLKKTNFMVKIEAIVTMGTDNAGDFAKVMERDIAGCVCQPLTGNPDQKVIPMSCICRKKGHKWEIKEK
jgi:hypothetical protein